MAAVQVYRAKQSQMLRMLPESTWPSFQIPSSIDLVLSGHVHGGCVRLPLIGGVLSPERKFFPKYSLGKYTEKNTTMIVTSGLGKFRLFNPPEIVVIDLIN
jgi:predicted MPP superfamily phosphohydrolase